MMKVIHNLIVTSLASTSAQRLHSRVRLLKNSIRKCACKTLAHYENFTLECVRSTRTRECELALNLYRTLCIMRTVQVQQFSDLSCHLTLLHSVLYKAE